VVCWYRLLNAFFGCQQTSYSVAHAEDVQSALPCHVHVAAMVQPNATEAFKSVKDAYEILSDPKQRAAYNRDKVMQCGACRPRMLCVQWPPPPQPQC